MFRTSILFINILLFVPLVAQHPSTNEVFAHYEIIKIDTDKILEKLSRKGKGKKKIKIGKWLILADEANILANDYSSLNHDFYKNKILREEIFPVEGMTANGGKAVLTFGKDYAFGFIEDDGELYYLEPAFHYQDHKDKKKNNYILYQSNDVITSGVQACGVGEEEILRANISTPVRQSGLCRIVDIALCSDWSMVAKYGSVSALEMHLIGLFNSVRANYDDDLEDPIQFVLTGQFIVDIPGGDPWTSSTDSRELLFSFRDWAKINLSYPHDIASLWTDRELNGDIVGVAWTYGLCQEDFKYNILQDFHPDQEMKRVLWAHEIGHNLGAGHDASGTNFIMSPNVNLTTTWSSDSKYNIDQYLPFQPCVDICDGETPQLEFVQQYRHMDELEITGNIDSCQVEYEDLEVGIRLSHYPDLPFTASVYVHSSSTSTPNSDFVLLTPSIDFDTTGSLEKNVIIRVYDDVFEEEREQLILELAVSSTGVNIGGKNKFTLELTSNEDLVYAECCSAFTDFTITGDPVYLKPIMFFGGREDARARMIIPAALLQIQGMSAGYIDQISLYVRTKTSNGIYHDFTIRMQNVPEVNLDTSPWYTATQVFSSDYETREDAWNTFTFDNPYYWDGVSSIYLQMCFDNQFPIGSDFIGTFAYNVGGETCGTRIANGQNGCALNLYNTYYYYDDRIPEIRFRMKTPLEVATDEVVQTNNRLFKGEEGHFFDVNKNLVASIKNTGSQDMECVEVSLISTGNAVQELPLTQFQASEKEWYLDMGVKSSSRITLYCTWEELQVWGGNPDYLNVIQSEVPISVSNTENRKIITSIERYEIADSIYAITTEIVGGGYLALTGGWEDHSLGTFSASLVMSSAGGEIVMSNSFDSTYAWNISNDYLIKTNPTNSNISPTNFAGKDLSLSGTGNRLIMKLPNGQYVEVAIDTYGEIIINQITSLPTHYVECQDDSFIINDEEYGIVLTNSAGDCWRIYIDDYGQLSTLQVACE